MKRKIQEILNNNEDEKSIKLEITSVFKEYEAERDYNSRVLQLFSTFPKVEEKPENPFLSDFIKQEPVLCINDPNSKMRGDWESYKKLLCKMLYGKYGTINLDFKLVGEDKKFVMDKRSYLETIHKCYLENSKDLRKNEDDEIDKCDLWVVIITVLCDIGWNCCCGIALYHVLAQLVAEDISKCDELIKGVIYLYSLFNYYCACNKNKEVDISKLDNFMTNFFIEIVNTKISTNLYVCGHIGDPFTTWIVLINK